MKNIFKHNNVIFLDIDGVICTARACTAINQRGIRRHFDPVALKLLSKIVTTYDCILVLSSTWRNIKPRQYFVDRFVECGHPELANAIPESEHEWCTPTHNKCRGVEIQAWLNEWCYSELYDNYVILDDSSDMLKCQLEHFVQCNTYDGIGYIDHEKCKHIFNGNPLSTFEI